MDNHLIQHICLQKVLIVHIPNDSCLGNAIDLMGQLHITAVCDLTLVISQRQQQLWQYT